MRFTRQIRYVAGTVGVAGWAAVAHEMAQPDPSYNAVTLTVNLAVVGTVIWGATFVVVRSDSEQIYRLGHVVGYDAGLRAGIEQERARQAGKVVELKPRAAAGRPGDPLQRASGQAPHAGSPE